MIYVVWESEVLHLTLEPYVFLYAALVLPLCWNLLLSNLMSFCKELVLPLCCIMLLWEKLLWQKLITI